MRRLAPLLALSLGSACAVTPGDHALPMDFRVRSPTLALSRITSDLHLRIFPKADLACRADQGLIYRGDARVTTDFGGRDVMPHVRCGTGWDAMRMAFGEAMPTDLCVPIARAGNTMVDLAAGTYIVLVEGSGNFVGAGGTTRVGILGSACTEVTLMAGQTSSAMLVLQEQREVTGVCGDRNIDANEMCDDGPAGSDNCTARCRFPERLVHAPTAPGMNKRRPSVAWSRNQRLVVGWDNADDVFVHVFDLAGVPLTTPAAFANDQALDPTPSGQQQNARLAAGATGWVGAWENFGGPGGRSNFDVETVVAPSYDTISTSGNVLANGTRTAMHDMRNAAVAVSGARVAWVWEDQTSATATTLRVSSAALASPPGMLTADAVLVSAGPAATNPAQARIAPLGTGFVVVWSAGAAGSRDVYAVRLDGNGVAMGTPVMVNTQMGNNQTLPAVAVRGDDVVVAWRDDSATGDDTMGATVRWRRLNATLAGDGPDRVAPTTIAGDQDAPTVAVSDAGVVLLAWADPSGAIRARMVTVAGESLFNRVTATAGDFEVNAAPDEAEHGAGERVLPSAGYGGMGRFVVAWEDRNGGGAGRAQVRMRTLRED